MARLTFFPLGCADTTLIAFRDGRRMLVDYADKRSTDPEDKRCDLPALLEADLEAAGRSDYTVVAFSHLDEDHCRGAPNFFHLEWAAKYQGVDRPRIETMWVPAAAITEECLSDPDAKVLRSEARHRLRNGRGILVFSRPERLKAWFEAEGLVMDDFRHCFVDAGRIAGGFDLSTDGVEFFAHSPHATRSDERGIEDRNGDSLVFQARFREGDRVSDVLFSSDVDHTVIAEIVDITRHYENDDRLHWDIYHLPHHCSYTAIGDDKGEDVTEPSDQVAWLCEVQGERGGYVISPSKPIPLKGTLEDRDSQPPHRQAAEYYRSVLADPANLLVTMEQPSVADPQPIVIDISAAGAMRVYGAHLAPNPLLRAASVAPAATGLVFPNTARVPTKPRGFA